MWHILTINRISYAYLTHHPHTHNKTPKYFPYIKYFSRKFSKSNCTNRLVAWLWKTNLLMVEFGEGKSLNSPNFELSRRAVTSEIMLCAVSYNFITHNTTIIIILSMRIHTHILRQKLNNFSGFYVGSITSNTPHSLIFSKLRARHGIIHI